MLRCLQYPNVHRIWNTPRGWISRRFAYHQYSGSLRFGISSWEGFEMKKLTPPDVVKIMKWHALDVWQQIPVDNFCIGVPVGDPDPCISVEVPDGMKHLVPKSVVLDTKEYGSVEIELKAVEGFIPMKPYVNTRMGV